GHDNSVNATDLAVDAAGNVYPTGYYGGGTADFNPDGGSAVLTAPAQSEEVFVAKLDRSGGLTWVRGLNRADNAGAFYSFDYPGGLVVDDAGRLQVAGSFE